MTLRYGQGMRQGWYDGIYMRRLIRMILVLAGLLTVVGGVGVVTWWRLVASIKPLPGFEARADVPTVAVSELGKWREIMPGAARSEFGLGDGATGTLVVYRFEPVKFRVRMMAEPAPKSVGNWLKEVGGDGLVVNGVYFNEDYSPSGLVRLGGMEIGRRRFDVDKSGLIIFGPELRLVDTTKEAVKLDKLADAAQSYPFLIRDGKAAVAEDSKLTARRTFIGQDVNGKIYVGAVTAGEVSLFGLSRALVNTGIAWQMVLNLDGGPSTGLSTKFGDWAETRDSLVGVPNVVMVEVRPESE